MSFSDKMKKWTTKDIPDLSGKVIVVTGGNSGLGYESVKAFAENGAEVILACRSVEKGKAAKENIGRVKGLIQVMSLDLDKPNSIHQFAKNFEEKYSRLDVLLNNAGVMQIPYSLSTFGVEKQLSVNHLSHFMLTSLLMYLISKTPQARVVSVSSLAHRKGVLQLDDVNYNKGTDYDAMTAYRRSKLANLYFSYELQRFFESERMDAVSLAAHPGVAPTNLMNHKFSKLGQLLIRPLAKMLLQKVSVGALALIRAAVDPNAQGAEFYGPASKNEWRGFPVLVQSTPASKDENIAKQLWNFSEKMTGHKFIISPV